MAGKRFPIIDLEGPGTVQLSLEERFATLMNIFKHQYFAVYRHIGRRFGWDTANAIAQEVADEAVPFIASAYKKKFGLEGEGAALISQVLQAEFQGEGSDVAVTEESPERAHLHILCMFGDALQSGRFADVDITNGLCHQGCTGWMQQVAETVDPDLVVTRHTWMGDGAPRCHFEIARTSAGDTGSGPP